MAERQAFAPGFTACLCFALLVAMAAATAALAEEDRTKAQEYINKAVSIGKSRQGAGGQSRGRQEGHVGPTAEGGPEIHN